MEYVGEIGIHKAQERHRPAVIHARRPQHGQCCDRPAVEMVRSTDDAAVLDIFILVFLPDGDGHILTAALL